MRNRNRNISRPLPSVTSAAAAAAAALKSICATFLARRGVPSLRPGCKRKGNEEKAALSTAATCSAGIVQRVFVVAGEILRGLVEPSGRHFEQAAPLQVQVALRDA